MILPLSGDDDEEKSSDRAQSTPVAVGEWTWEYEGFRGRKVEDSVKLAVEEGSVTGEHQGFFGSTKIDNGKLDGNEVSFSVSRSFGDRKMTSTYSGKVEGDKITGSIETEGFNDTRKIDWNAYRKPEIDPNGLWLWKSAGRGGSERKNWVKLSYDKGKLSGLYMTERSQVPIQNATLKGKTVRFELSRRGRGGRGQSRTTVYDGDLSEKGIFGSITTKLQDEDRVTDWEAARDTPEVDPLGTWTWKQRRSNDEEIEHKIVIKKAEGGSLSGMYARNEDSSNLEGVKLEGDVLSFKVTRETERGSFSSTYSGKIDEDVIAGSVSGSRGEFTWRFPFEAERQLPKPEPAGTWTWTTRRFSRDGGGQEVKNSLTLKTEEGRLAGSYSAGDRSSDIKNAKLNGNTLTFEIKRTFGDRSVTIRYEGIIRGDSVRGTSRFQPSEESESTASQWANRWEAKREK